MCSIIGYLGQKQAAPMLVRGLQRMEYRGYDSTGVATVFQDKIIVKKGVGKVAEVNSIIHLDKLPGEAGIGHTRWATHGAATEANAHPQLSSSGEIAIIHNGIIDNYQELRQKLMQEGYTFESETDSEVIANLLQFHYDRNNNVKEAVIGSVAELVGDYAFVAIFENETLAAARFHEPLIVGVSKEGYFVASDVLGFLEYTDAAVYVDNGDIVILNHDGVSFCNFEGKPVDRQPIKIAYEMADLDKGGYVHHTLKEIYDQPVTVLKAGDKTNLELGEAIKLIKRSSNIYIAASGTSFHAALVAKYLFSNYARINVEPILASEARFSPNYFDENSVLIAISQSGETADVLEAVGIAKEKGAKIISIVNVMTSSLVRASSISIGLNCGPEIGVAATKSFTSELAVLYKIADGLCGGCVGVDFNEVSTQISNMLLAHSKIEDLARKIRNASDIYVLGRGINYCIAAEAALKLKELAYVHAEALPGGELKHGPLALLDSDSYVIVLCPSDSTSTHAIASAHQAKARGAKIIGVSDRPNEIYDYWIEIPKVNPNLFPFVETIPLQLLSYYLALEKNANPDYPRNLAKSVTVK
ncbi:MAG: glutamine--fructose-6-phosphate transaminase (isomerizing) [Nitrososphaerales archaeon]